MSKLTIEYNGMTVVIDNDTMIEDLIGRGISPRDIPTILNQTKNCINCMIEQWNERELTERRAKGY